MPDVATAIMTFYHSDASQGNDGSMLDFSKGNTGAARRTKNHLRKKIKQASVM
jgi:hypothetical protein